MADDTQSQLDLEIPLEQNPIRACNDCGTELPLTSFRRNSNFREGYQLICSECSTAGVRRSRGVSKDASYLRPSSTDRCGICGGQGDKRGLHLDHDHKTGDFRGWLCHHCNAGIGHFDDDPERLRSAIRYLTAELEVNLSS